MENIQLNVFLISNAEVCPVVYEIIEELKEIYNFKSYR